MGEYAEMMLDGTCCSTCGELLGGPEDWADPAGYAVQCSSCQAETEQIDPRGMFPKSMGQIDAALERTCDTCGKILKSKEGVYAHKRDKHGER